MVLNIEIIELVKKCWNRNYNTALLVFNPDTTSDELNFGRFIEVEEFDGNIFLTDTDREESISHSVIMDLSSTYSGGELKVFIDTGEFVSGNSVMRVYHFNIINNTSYKNVDYKLVADDYFYNNTMGMYDSIVACDLEGNEVCIPDYKEN